MMRRGLMVGLMFLFLMTLSGSQGEIIIVDDDGGAWADYSNLNEAFNNTSANDTIQIFSGQYSLSKPLEVFFSLNIIGNGSDTIISYNGTVLISKNCSDVSIVNITIYGGIYIEDTGRLLLSNIHSNNWNGTAYVDIYRVDQLTINSCSFSGHNYSHNMSWDDNNWYYISIRGADGFINNSNFTITDITFDSRGYVNNCNFTNFTMRTGQFNYTNCIFQNAKWNETNPTPSKGWVQFDASDRSISLTDCQFSYIERIEFIDLHLTMRNCSLNQIFEFVSSGSLNLISNEFTDVYRTLIGQGYPKVRSIISDNSFQFKMLNSTSFNTTPLISDMHPMIYLHVYSNDIIILNNSFLSHTDASSDNLTGLLVIIAGDGYIRTEWSNITIESNHFSNLKYAIVVRNITSRQISHGRYKKIVLSVDIDNNSVVDCHHDIIFNRVINGTIRHEAQIEPTDPYIDIIIEESDCIIQNSSFGDIVIYESTFSCRNSSFGTVYIIQSTIMIVNSQMDSILISNSSTTIVGSSVAGFLSQWETTCQGLTLIDSEFRQISVKHVINNGTMSIWNCTINPYGITIRNTTNMTIQNSKIIDTEFGLRIHDSYNISVQSCSFRLNPVGLDVRNSTVQIFNNSFVNNTLSAWSENSTEFWDNGSFGNYWSDYNGTDDDDDGIGDTAYVINGNHSIDRYPLWNISIPSNNVTEPKLEIDISIWMDTHSPLVNQNVTLFIRIEVSIAQNDTLMEIYLDGILSSQFEVNLNQGSNEYSEWWIAVEGNHTVQVVLGDPINISESVVITVNKKASSDSATSIPNCGYVVLSFMTVLMIIIRKRSY